VYEPADEDTLSTTTLEEDGAEVTLLRPASKGPR
jgi:hypothetical protein